MSTVLDRILAAKRAEVAQARAEVPLARMELQAASAPPTRGFERALRSSIEARGVGVIAEIKRASPSKGLIRPDFDPVRIAAGYHAHGAACLSVLTDREFFGGSPDDLRVARAACPLPVLRKDFIVDPYQVFEARSWGADCILLIMDAAPDPELLELEDLAHGLGMDVLVESHDMDQLDRALHFRSRLMGINNRDLRTFETHLQTTLSLISRVPDGRLGITESGISQPADVKLLYENGVSAYLVGSAFMSASDPGQELARVFEGHLSGR